MQNNNQPQSQQTTWISVKQRLPKHDKMVIVSDGKKTWGAYFNRTHGKGSDRWAITFSFWHYGHPIPFKAEDITHWMEQPKPPKS